MKITYIESPEGLSHSGVEWEKLKQQIVLERPDILVTNEMPFGKWLAGEKKFNADAAKTSVLEHDSGIEALKNLAVPIILSSRPVPYGARLVNEGFALINGDYHFAHHKHYFPAEPGFFETSWFHTEKKGFDLIKTKELNIGFLLCTELMFNEWARSYGRQGAHLLVAPRATGQSIDRWKTAASMAAIVSGCYVVSSNRVGKFDDGLTFGGTGFAFAPDGTFISETSSENTVNSFEFDLDVVVSQKLQYPCYVRETGLNQ